MNLVTAEKENRGAQINPFLLELHLYITKYTVIPCYILLLATCCVTLYIIVRHLHNKILHYSLLFYTLTQLTLLFTLTTSWGIDFIAPNKTDTKCKILTELQTFSLILPAYAVLLMTIIRAVFISKPLTYYRYISKERQGVVVLCFVSICGALSSLPLLGLCDVTVSRVNIRVYHPDRAPTIDSIEFCEYGGDGGGTHNTSNSDIPHNTSNDCVMFFVILTLVGYILPILAVTGIYLYINNIVSHATQTHLILTVSNPTSESSESGVTSRGKPMNKFKENMRMPWSILLILTMYGISTLPWIPTEIHTKKIMESLINNDKTVILVDMLYGITQITVSMSPVVYIITTRSLKHTLLKLYRKYITS